MKAPYVRALALYAAFALGYPWFSAWCFARLPEGNLSWLLVEASSLALVCLLVALVRDRARAVRTAGDRRAVALQTLLVLGVLALALRIFDPEFDSQEIGLQSLGTRTALVGYLLTLPCAVAAEELVFRTCQSLLRRLLHPVPVVLAVGLSFAIYHWVPGSPLDRHALETLIATFAGGLVLASAFERTSSVGTLIAIHLVYDGLAIAQALLNVAHARAMEACLFLLWLAVSGALGFRRRRAAAPSDSGPPPDLPPRPITAWIAAAIFGCGFPLLLSWIRMRLG